MKNRYGLIGFNKPSNSGGFFSNYFSLLSSSGVCVADGIIPYIDCSHTWFNPTCNFEEDIVTDASINPWDWWFKQSIEPRSFIYTVPLDRTPINHNPLTFNTQHSLDYFRWIAKDYFIIRDNILQEVEFFYQKYLENRTNLAILARGTEMLIHHPEYPKVQLQTWADIIDRYLTDNPGIDNIFLVSDDSDIINVIVEKFPNTVYLKDFFRKTTQSKEEIENKNKPWWLISPSGDPNHRKRLGEECLIQALLLSRCQYFLGTCSGISNAVQFFNSNKFIKSTVI
jgi:hypothetical protein